MRLLRSIVTIATLAGLLLLPTGATAAQSPQWHVDFLVAYHAGPRDSATPAQWTTTGSVARWEVDVDPDAVFLSWVRVDGDFGTYAYVDHTVADGRPHRIHVDARQVGPNIVLALTVSGFVIQPITVEDQRIGPITQVVQSPAQPVRQATFTADVTGLTAWNN